MQDLIGGHVIKNGKVAEKKLENLEGKNETCSTTR